MNARPHIVINKYGHRLMTWADVDKKTGKVLTTHAYHIDPMPWHIFIDYTRFNPPRRHNG
jgi:hypothetical protein